MSFPDASVDAYRVATLDLARERNPYIRLFYGAMAPHGVTPVERLVVNDDWLLEQSGRLDALHFHWPEGYWRVRGTQAFGRLRGVAGLWRYLRLARRLGMRVVWTLHNLECHEGADQVDRLGYRVLARQADLIICHSQSVAESVRRRDHPRGEVVVMPIGNYEGAYPPPHSRPDTLRGLGLSADLPVVCALGYLRGYKGLEVAGEAICRLGGGVQLVVGGQPGDDFDLESFRDVTASIPRCILIDRPLNDQEFADIVAASEAVLLPYRKITGSANLLTAWTLGRGVVASDLPYFSEMLEGAAEAGTLFRAGDAADLARAIRTYLNIPAEARNQAALAQARRYSWDRAIEPVAAVFERWMADESSRGQRGR